MNNEEAMKAIKNILTCVSTECNHICEKCELYNPDSSYGKEAFKTAISALDKAEKYRWHDLRKNPDDLPSKIEVPYLVAYTEKCGYVPYGFEIYLGKGEGDWNTTWNIIAWREIEPFEEKTE